MSIHDTNHTETCGYDGAITGCSCGAFSKNKTNPGLTTPPLRQAGNNRGKRSSDTGTSALDHETERPDTIPSGGIHP